MYIRYSFGQYYTKFGVMGKKTQNVLFEPLDPTKTSMGVFFVTNKVSNVS